MGNYTTDLIFRGFLFSCLLEVLKRQCNVRGEASRAPWIQRSIHMEVLPGETPSLGLWFLIKKAVTTLNSNILVL